MHRGAAREAYPFSRRANIRGPLLRASIASLPTTSQYPYWNSRKPISILIIATFVVIVVSHQRAKCGLGSIWWWLLVSAMPIRRLLPLGCRLSFRINLCFLCLRLHGNYNVFQERWLAPLRRWLRSAILKSHKHTSDSAGQIRETHFDVPFIAAWMRDLTKKLAWW